MTLAKPWHVYQIERHVARIRDANDSLVAECAGDDALNTASLIARAVNCHDDMLAALKAMAGYWHSSNDDPEETRIYALALAAIAEGKL